MIPTKKEHFQQIIRNRIFWPRFKAHDFSPNFSPSSSAEKKLFRNGFLSSSNSASWRYGGRWLVEVFSFYFLNSHEKTLVLTSRIGHLEVSDNVTQVQKVSFKLFQNHWFILKEIKLFFNLFLFRVDAAWTYIWKIHRESIENKVFLFHLQFMAFCIIINKGNRLILFLEKHENGVILFREH